MVASCDVVYGQSTAAICIVTRVRLLIDQYGLLMDDAIDSMDASWSISVSL